MRLKLGQKIICFLAVFILLISGLEIVAYHTLQRIQKRFSFVEMADDLTVSLLEMRRSEKNYFLYRDTRALDDVLEHVHHIKHVSNDLRGEIIEIVGNETFSGFIHNLDDYRRTVEALLKKDGLDNGNVNRLRIKGRVLHDFTDDLVRLERLGIGNFLKKYQSLSFGAVIFVLLFGALSYYLVRSHIILPLNWIELTTRKISQGDFTLIPEVKWKDEVGSCILAFNRMVQELAVNQDNLVQTKKLASLGTLASGIAHEINNPLNNISTSCQILMEEIDSRDKEYLQKLLSNISIQTDKARDIVKNLLEFSRDKTFSLERVRLRELVDDSLELVESDLPKNVEVRIQIPEDFPVLIVDRSRMQQVFIAIVQNAIQAMPDGGILSLKAHTQDGGVAIEISDTGVGISEENLAKVFDPFFSTKEVGKGTGLGLSVSYGIVEKHGGRLTAKSRIGEGSTFTVTLPSGACPT